MSLAPIIIFVYNRADHFIQTYNALAACKEAKESELYIFSDGAKNEAGKAKVDEVRAAVAAIKNAGDFKAVTVTESPVNRGLAASVIAGVTEVIGKHGKVIVVEDDCKVSPHFLFYINGALDYYENNKKIGSIAGYTPMIELPEDYKNDIFAAYRSCSCTWATWSDRWQNIDWELRDIGSFYRSPKLIKKLNSNGSDRFIRLYRQTKGNGSSWSVRFGAHLVKNDLLTVYPRYSYITNIGCDESGVHSKADDAEKMRVDLSRAIADPVFADVKIDKRIQKIFKKHYSYGLVSELKKFIATVLIVIKERLKG
ncbi:MAG: glycosyltransferase [Clostridia bacterium]|nr:glycosyltransferase [Clostridia bacterium]